MPYNGMSVKVLGEHGVRQMKLQDEDLTGVLVR
jgi:hypothetical protein